MKENRKQIAAILFGLLLFVLVFATGILDTEKVWADLSYLHMDFGGRYSRNMVDGDEYGVMNGGPGFDLPAGEYRLKWYIESDGNNRLQFVSGNGAEIVPGEIALEADSPAGEATFTLRSAAENVEIRVVFENGTRINVADMRLYSPQYRDHAFTFAFAVIAACALYVLSLRGWLTPARRGKLILLGFAVLIASATALKDTVCIGHDTTFHLVRLCNLADGFKTGFPVRAGGFSYNGYGAITSVFYPDIFLYPFALMMNMGVSLQYAFNLLMISVNAASAWTMYAAAKRIFRQDWAGMCASILYTLSIYRISDVFTRYAVGEMLAMVFLPLFLLGLYEVVLGDKRRFVLLGVSASCIYLSHMLSTLICALTAVGVCALFVVKIVREKRLLSLVKAACVAGLLSAFQLVPFLMYSMQGIGAQELAKDPGYFAIHPAQLFLLGAGEMGVDPKDIALSGFALEIGLPLLMAAALTLYSVAVREEREEKDRFAVLLIAAGVFFAFMATTLFPWGHVRVLTRGLSDYLQFPWRFLMMTAVLFALAGGYGLVRFARGHGEQMAAAALAVAAVCALPTLTDETRNADYIAFGETVSPKFNYLEYTIPGTKIAPTNDCSLLLEGEVEITQYQKRSTTVRAMVDAAGDAKIALPLFGYDGYRAEVDGKAMETELGDNNRLTICLPAGTQGELRVWFDGKLVWRIAEGVSLLTALLLGFYGKRARKMRRRNDE